MSPKTADGGDSGSAPEDDLLIDHEKDPEESGSRILWMLGQFTIVFVFIVFGAGFSLATAASSSSDGKEHYDPMAAVTCTEFIKLVISVVWILAVDRSSLIWPPRRWAWDAASLSVVAFLFALQNTLNYLVVERLGAVLFMLLGNLKIVFTVLFMRCLLGKSFSPLQWFAVVLLTLSSTVVKGDALFGLEPAGETHKLIVGMALLLVCTASSGFAAVYNELLLKQKDDKDVPMPFMMKNAVLYVWGVCINFVSWRTWGTHSFFEGFNTYLWLSIACCVIFGLSCAVMLGFLDNVVRCFAGVGQVLFTIVASRALPSHLHQGSFNLYYVASLALLAAALVIYSQHESKQLLPYTGAGVGLALVVGLACFFLGGGFASS